MASTGQQRRHNLSFVEESDEKNILQEFSHNHVDETKNKVKCPPIKDQESPDGGVDL